jgi:hypothetical protein
MKLDIAKIDDRIKKLQEIRRIAAEPEILEGLMEFLVLEDRDGKPDSDGAEPARAAFEASANRGNDAGAFGLLGRRRTATP